ncbi:hypothetical protein [Paenibacillus medicaginis]|uniref:Uncharacterized protein n=1 Tax=Paenibacillus medicaginis TaxID=1470560 RepID=A0ABV5BUT0_9BACL
MDKEKLNKIRQEAGRFGLSIHPNFNVDSLTEAKNRLKVAEEKLKATIDEKEIEVINFHINELKKHINVLESIKTDFKG